MGTCSGTPNGACAPCSSKCGSEEDKELEVSGAPALPGLDVPCEIKDENKEEDLTSKGNLAKDAVPEGSETDLLADTTGSLAAVLEEIPSHPSSANSIDTVQDSVEDAAAQTTAEKQAESLLKSLRACEAAALLGNSSRGDGGDLRENLNMQLHALGDALVTLADHPGLATAEVSSGSASPSEFLLEVSVPGSPASAQELKAERCEQTAQSPGNSAKRDLLEVNFELDDQGRHVECVIEFFADGSASIMWTAFDLPLPLPKVICLVHEIDLIGDLVPFVKDAGVLHQFSSNAADRLVRVVSQPPIPMVSGLEAVAQRFCYDLLDSAWEAFCLVEVGPTWTSCDSSPDAGTQSREEQWRGVRKPPPFKQGLRQVEVKKVVALARPCGPGGENTTILFSGRGDMKVPRSLLPNWLCSWLVKTIGRYVYQQALDRTAKFESSKHGERMRGSDFYPDLHSRIKAYVDAKQSAA